jgi:8-oxo-dGTP diphosphatase
MQSTQACISIGNPIMTANSIANSLQGRTSENRVAAKLAPQAAPDDTIQPRGKVTMKEKIKGWLAGLAYRVIVLFTFGQISPLLGAGAIIEQDGKILLIDRSDGLGYTIPGGIVRHKETLEKCVLREVREETGYEIKLTGLVGAYSQLGRDPRFRAIAIAYKGTIVSGTQHGSGEGESCWRSPEVVFGHMAFDCEDMLKDYLSGQQSLS